MEITAKCYIEKEVFNKALRKALESEIDFQMIPEDAEIEILDGRTSKIPIMLRWETK